MSNFATVNDIILLFRPLSASEIEKAEALLDVVSDSLREEAKKVNKDLDAMVSESVSFASVAKSVTVDVVARALMTSTDTEPMSQFSESAMGYTFSGSPLVAGGGLFVKKSELDRLGLRRQRYGSIELI